MRKQRLSSYFILLVLVVSIISLDISRRYLSGEFATDDFEFEFLYSSEKSKWLNTVVTGFEKEWSANHSGQSINVIMNPIGSGKGNNQVASGASKPTVWSPASKFWLPILNRLWTENHANDIVEIDSPSLVVSPTIIATWKSYEEEHNITGLNDLRNLALIDPDFTFAHTDPFESNSGFGGVIMEVAVAAGKNPENLTVDDLAADHVQQWMRELESAAVQYGSSTGFLGKLMASGGPSQLKAAIMYENLVVEKNKELEDERLVAVYPSEGTLLNDHPYAILDAPWVSSQDKELAEDFVKFLKSPRIQIKAIDYGFRPSVDLGNEVQELEEIFTEEAGVRQSLAGIKIYDVGNIPGDILERIPDLWTATRSRSLGSDNVEALKLEPADYIMPAILASLMLVILLSPVVSRIRRYYQ
ncbi:MAG: substrate-binding domain-containing protein [Candidatus Kariarchaeaceae archaeon]|jgi:Ca-activated chloride channel family protein